jgi:hypothetical protein
MSVACEGERARRVEEKGKKQDGLFPQDGQTQNRPQMLGPPGHPIRRGETCDQGPREARSLAHRKTATLPDGWSGATPGAQSLLQQRGNGTSPGGNWSCRNHSDLSQPERRSFASSDAPSYARERYPVPERPGQKSD